jgi:hypothetical protein
MIIFTIIPSGILTYMVNLFFELFKVLSLKIEEKYNNSLWFRCPGRTTISRTIKCERRTFSTDIQRNFSPKNIGRIWQWVYSWDSAISTSKIRRRSFRRRLGLKNDLLSQAKVLPAEVHWQSQTKPIFLKQLLSTCLLDPHLPNFRKFCEDFFREF